MDKAENQILRYEELRQILTMAIIHFGTNKSAGSNLPLELDDTSLAMEIILKSDIRSVQDEEAEWQIRLFSTASASVVESVEGKNLYDQLSKFQRVADPLQEGFSFEDSSGNSFHLKFSKSQIQKLLLFFEEPPEVVVKLKVPFVSESSKGTAYVEIEDNATDILVKINSDIEEYVSIADIVEFYSER